MGMKGIPPLRSHGQLGLCDMFIYQVRPREYSQPCISFPHASANGILYNLAPIKSLPCENLPWLPSAAPRTSLTSCYGVSSPPHSISLQNTAFLTPQVFAPSLHLLSAPWLVMLCPQLSAWLPPSPDYM